MDSPTLLGTAPSSPLPDSSGLRGRIRGESALGDGAEGAPSSHCSQLRQAALMGKERDEMPALITTYSNERGGKLALCQEHKQQALVESGSDHPVGYPHVHRGATQRRDNRYCDWCVETHRHVSTSNLPPEQRDCDICGEAM